MIQSTLGQAIIAARQSYGRRVQNVAMRVKLSQDKLWELCCEAQGDGAGLFTGMDAGGRSKIRSFETGELCPTTGQLRVIERVLGLEPHSLDQFLPMQQLDRGSKETKTADVDTQAAPPIHLSDPKATPEPRGDSGRAVLTNLNASGDWLAQLGKIEPAIEAGVKAQPGSGRRFALPQDTDTDDEYIKELRKALRREPRLIVLSGEPFLGKKTKIKGLLRLITETSDALIYDLAVEGKPVERLPIRAWSARRLHYRELVERVHDFLEEYYHARLGRNAHEPATLPMPEHRRPLDELIERINVNFRDLPAVFIFTDVDAFGENHARNVVRDIGIEQLIRTLLDANKASRIVITTNDFEAKGKRSRQLINFPKHQLIRIDPPQLSELKHFVRREIRSAVSLYALYLHDATARVDDLVALAALINLTYRDESKGLPEGATNVIERFVYSSAEHRDSSRRDVYRQLVDAIVQSSLLHPIALIAASEDGVRLDSMRYLLGVWRQQNDEVASYVDDGALNAALADFASTAGVLFLQRSGIVRYDAEEYDVHEKHGAEDTVWEMAPVISMYFLDALRKLDAKIPSHAHRLIALIARIRSQQKKVSMRTLIGSRASEEGSRDIQCYVNLLASISLGVGDQLATNGPPLRLSEREIFAIDERFRPARALRFAVFCLLKEDIDHDYRLTMVFDEDALRLDLFLLLFQELGRVYAPEVEPLKLPPVLPKHLTSGIFSPEEILDLMSTIALSAFHAQRFDVVDEVVKLATEFASQHGIPESAIVLSRLWCCKFDASIRRGCWAQGLGHRETLAVVSTKRREWFPDLADAVPKQPIEPEQLNYHRAHLRLLVREAELTGLVEEDRAKSIALYQKVEIIEAAVPTTAEQHDPVVLSGRIGRHYIEFLLRDLTVVTPSPATQILRGEILDNVEALISVNMSRLRRFSGADRVGVMLDMARLRLARGDLSGAHDYAESAKRRAFSGSVSHGGKLDVFQVLAEVKLSLVEQANIVTLPEGYDSPRLLKEARTAVRNLRSVAEHLLYAPSLGMAHLLEARIALITDMQRRKRVSVTADRYLSEALKAIRNARAALGPIGQVNLDAMLNALDREAHARLDA